MKLVLEYGVRVYSYSFTVCVSEKFKQERNCKKKQKNYEKARWALKNEKSKYTPRKQVVFKWFDALIGIYGNKGTVTTKEQKE